MRLEITDLKDDSSNGKSNRKDRPNKGICSLCNVFFVLMMNFKSRNSKTGYQLTVHFMFIDIDEWNFSLFTFLRL